MVCMAEKDAKEIHNGWMDLCILVRTASIFTGSTAIIDHEDQKNI